MTDDGAETMKKQSAIHYYRMEISFVTLIRNRLFPIFRLFIFFTNWSLWNSIPGSKKKISTCIDVMHLASQGET